MKSKFFHPSWLVRTYSDKMLSKYVPVYIKGDLLDVGCGTKPYASMVSPYVSSHIGVDHAGMIHDNGKVDIFADAYNIPTADCSFDCILCTQVLEHLEEPIKAFEEFHRILKEKSYVIITVPFCWHLHEQPRDFYRYTKHGLMYLAEKAGLMTVELKSYGGFAMYVFSELAYCIFSITKIRFVRPLLIVLMNIALFAGWLLNFIDPTKELAPCGYACVFMKATH